MIAMIVRTKKCTFLLGLIVFCFLMGGEAIAAGDGGDVPSLITGDRGIQWVNTTSVKVNLSFDGSKAICGACVIGKANTSKITGTVVLARKNSDGTYTTVKKWSDLKAAGDKLIFDKTYYVSKGYTYRLTITSTVYRNGSGETVSGSYGAYAS